LADCACVDDQSKYGAPIKAREVFGLHKAGYLLPIMLSVRELAMAATGMSCSINQSICLPLSLNARRDLLFHS
jgi:hypothetical protein